MISCLCFFSLVSLPPPLFLTHHQSESRDFTRQRYAFRDLWSCEVPHLFEPLSGQVLMAARLLMARRSSVLFPSLVIIFSTSEITLSFPSYPNYVTLVGHIFAASCLLVTGRVIETRFILLREFLVQMFTIPRLFMLLHTVSLLASSFPPFFDKYRRVQLFFFRSM